MKDTVVFVYGSLKKGSYNHSFLLNAEFISFFVTEPKYTMVDVGMYPAVLLGGNTAIHGEVYKVSSEELSTLDELEGYPAYYDRILIPSEYGEAWMYVLPNNTENYSIIASGLWNI